MSMKHKRRALVAIHESAVDQYVDIKRNEAIGQDSLFGGLDDEGGGFGVTVTIPEIDEWDKTTCSATSATCSASTSPTTRCSASSTC